MTYKTHKARIVPMMNFGFLANAGIAVDPPRRRRNDVKSLAAEIGLVNEFGRSAFHARANPISGRTLGERRWLSE
jgi:hypothetical protein